MVLTEPDVALTDFALCIMSAYFAYRLSRIKTAEPGAQRTAVAFFIALATASLLGGIVHGFFVVKGTLGNTVLWTLTMINLGVVAFLLWLIAASVMPGASMRAFKIVASALLIAYEGFILLVRRDFLVALIMASVASLVLLAGFVLRYIATRNSKWLVGAAGVLLTFLASGAQQLKISLHPIYFNHNALFHVIQAAALILLFHTLRWMLESKGELGGKPSSARD